MPGFCKILTYKNSHLEDFVFGQLYHLKIKILQFAQILDKAGNLMIIVSAQGECHIS